MFHVMISSLTKKEKELNYWASTRVNMQEHNIFNVVFLCIINVIIMVAGTFLNSVVIISLWKSRQLRKQLCYFMILVLSCFDLAVVIITHPFLIVSTIYYSLNHANRLWMDTRISISFILCGFSMTALLMLNIERFLALTCPYFHKKSVTKTKLVCFQSFLMTIIAGMSSLVYLNTETFAVNIFAAISILSLLFLLVYGNYKMFVIAISKRGDNRISATAATSVDNNRKSQILNLKNISTCSLVVVCFFVCSCPQVIFAFYRLATGAHSAYDRQDWLFSIWANTFGSINSTLNCLIFFWRNSILRREGMKITSAFRAHVTKFLS